MNCKQGDLAIIITPGSVNSGKIVQCITLYPTKLMKRPKGVELCSNVWYCEPALMSWTGEHSHYCMDENLRPIRDPGEDAKDEMLRPLPVESKSNERA